MGDKEEKKPKEKKIFSIPTAREIARLERGKSKVKSYFKSQFGNATSSALINGDGNSSKLATSNAANDISKGKRTSPGPCNGTSISENSSYRTTCTSNSQNTVHEVHVTSSTRGGTEPSTSADESAVRTKRKIGSAFADKFSALREGPDYEEPTVKRQAVSTAIVAAPIATGSKGPSGVNTIIVNTKQRGNPILKHIRNVPWEFGDIVPDYVMGRTVCALFLSLRYHHLNPNYIHNRLKDLGHQYELRVLLVQVDVKDPHYSVKELTRMALLADCTLILAWSAEEAGRYLETYKSYENKSADALKERVETDYLSKVTDVLSTVRSVNRTDAVTLVSTFGTFDKIIAASKEDLYLCPGFGPQKAQRLYDVLHEPFFRGSKEAQKATATEESTAAN